MSDFDSHITRRGFMKAGAVTIAGLAIAPDKFYGAVVEKDESCGMGKVVLEVNSVGGVNILTQAMINNGNTIYVIKYDYVLDGKINVPDNCILEFDGGSLRNGTITGHPKIKAPNICIFDNVSIELSNDIIYANWWKFGKDIDRNNVNLQQVFDAAYSAQGCIIKVTDQIIFSKTIKIWTYSSNSYIGYTLVVEGQQTGIPLFVFNNNTNGSKAFVITSKTDDNLKNGHCVIFRNLSIKSNNASYLIYTENASKIDITNCGLLCPKGTCFYSKKIWVWRIEESFIEGNVGLRVLNGTSAYISNLFVKGVECGIDICNSYVHISNVFGDYATGIFAHFGYCRGDISSIAAESPKLDSFIEAEQSLLEIQSIYLNNLVNPKASIFTGEDSSIHVGSMYVHGKGDTGYIENGRWNLRIEVEKLVTQLSFTRATHNQYDNGSGINVINWAHGSNPGFVQSNASERSWYRPIDDVTLQTDTFDGFYKDPRYPKKARLILGSVAPSYFIENIYDTHGKITGTVAKKHNQNVNIGDIFINSDVNYSPSNGVFFGWVCSGYASKLNKTFGNASWKKVQFVLAGKSRPAGLDKNHVGLQFFDESLSPKRPIWWNGNGWVDANGNSV